MILTALITAILSVAPSGLAGAVLTEDREVFRLFSPMSGELQVSKTIVVNSDEGLASAYFLLECDSFRSLKQFSGSVTPAGGKPHKLRKEDLVQTALSSGLVDDGIKYGYFPEGHFPLTVHYEWRISYHGGISSLPPFVPVDNDNLGVAEASYTLDVPEGFAVRSVSAGMEYSKVTQKGRDLHTWTVKGFEPVKKEEMMPPVMDLVPYLYCAPEVITLGGYQGMQRTWKEVGQWVWNLQEGTGELTPEEVSKVQELTEGCRSDFEKLQVLYSYLRGKTRYVSIQLGIGGYKPIPCGEVSRLGFGDCKGLSNYMRSLLAAAGVESFYYIISTSDRDLLPGYSSLGQMNHVMLAVPLPQMRDTVWVECTNPLLPLGYRHSDAAGHQVVLVKEDGGEEVRIPDYPDSLSRRRVISRVALQPDGSARLSIHREAFLDLAEKAMSFRELPPEGKTRYLSSLVSVHADDVRLTGVQDNFGDYALKGKDFVPEFDIDFTLTATSYADASGSRLFVPLNPAPMTVSVQKGARENRMYSAKGGVLEDVVYVQIPDGYHLEGIPDAMTIDSPWGTFIFEHSLEDGLLVVSQTILLKRFNQPASEYSSYREFARSVNRLYKSVAVLAKD